MAEQPTRPSHTWHNWKPPPPAPPPPPPTAAPHLHSGGPPPPPHHSSLQPPPPPPHGSASAPQQQKRPPGTGPGPAGGPGAKPGAPSGPKPLGGGPAPPPGPPPPPPKEKLATRQTEHSKELLNAFKPIKYFLMVTGQMPFVIKPKKDGTYSFKFHKFSAQVLIYFIMFFVTSGAYFLVTMGILSFILDSIFRWVQPTHTVIVKDKSTGLSETWKWERYIIRHEMVAMIVIWSWLTVAFAGSLYIVFNSKYYVHYMNYFNRVVQIMDMDMTPGVSAYLFRNNILSLLVAVGLTVGFGMGFIFDFTAVTNTASVISNFIFRLFNVEIERNPETKFGYQLLGWFIMVYALFASRANVIQFLFFSQLLKNGSKIWNERLRRVLLHEVATDDDDDQFARRLEPKLVYKDHLMIVQLYQMTENVFGTILFSYYSLTIISVVMELYQLAALQGFGTENTVGTKAGKDATEDEQKRKALLQDRTGVSFDSDTTHEHEVLATACVSIILLFQNVYFCYRTTVDAAKAYEYAMKGFDILRRHGLMYCKNKTDRNFVLSLYFSFAKNNPLQLTAGGYFAVNKLLLVTMASTVVNWAISIYQTKVDQWK